MRKKAVIKYICVQEEIEYLKSEKQRFQGSRAACVLKQCLKKVFSYFTFHML